jgi:hypothetical protein
MTQFTQTCDKTKNKEVELRPTHTLKRNGQILNSQSYICNKRKNKKPYVNVEIINK